MVTMQWDFEVINTDSDFIITKDLYEDFKKTFKEIHGRGRGTAGDTEEEKPEILEEDLFNIE